MPGQRNLPKCTSWRDWEQSPSLHGPFQYWRWRGDDPITSKQRLGERIYIIACLLWSSLHDTRFANELKGRYPNWSAISSYYGMVHALRLIWFVLYGSYPQMHRPIREALCPNGAAPVDWQREVLDGRKVKIASEALCGAMESGLHRSDLAERLGEVGVIVEKAAKLRNDSNYESLLLAHQYHHCRGGFADPSTTDFVNVREEFARATDSMSSANRSVLTLTADVLVAAFDNKAAWFCPRGEFSGDDLFELLLWYVLAKIESCHRQLETCDGDLIADWCQGLPELEKGLRSLPARTGAYAELGPHIRFELFELKRGIMEGFREKVRNLRQSVDGA